MNKNVLAIIPARGGSKGVKRKNLKLLCGKPLIQHAIESALGATGITDLIVSTDDSEIAEFARSFDVEVVVRPPELCQDHSLVIDAIEHAVKTLGDQGRHYDVITLLEATSPFRTSEMIDSCLQRFESPSVDSVATFCESGISPNRLWKISDSGKVETYIAGAVPWLPRQQQPTSYELNGLVYAFLKTNLFKTPKQPSFLTDNIDAVITSREDSIDIDTEIDFVLAEAIMKWRQDEKNR